MKIWYQSFVSFEKYPRYGQALQEYLCGLGNKELKFEAYGLRTGGIGEQYRIFGHITTLEVLENVHLANQKRFDAVAIGNIMDPGLYEAREISKIPVLGLCESSLLVACPMGGNFSIVTVAERLIPRIEESIRRYGFWERFKGIQTMTVGIPAIDRAFTNERLKRRVVEQFLIQARPLIRERADVIIPGGGMVMLLLALEGIHHVEEVPIVNGIVALAGLTEMMVRFRARTGVFISRRLTHASLDAKLLKEAQRLYRLR